MHGDALAFEQGDWRLKDNDASLKLQAYQGVRDALKQEGSPMKLLPKNSTHSEA
jgi:hypothetical protein